MWVTFCHGQGGSSHYPLYIAHGLSARNLALSASLCHHLLVSAIDLETSLDLALCQDTFYSKWSWLFLLLFIPSLISVFNTDFLWHVTWITLPLRL